MKTQIWIWDFTHLNLGFGISLQFEIGIWLILKFEFGISGCMKLGFCRRFGISVSSEIWIWDSGTPLVATKEPYNWVGVYDQQKY